LKASEGRTTAARLPIQKKKLYVTTSHKASSYSPGYDAAACAVHSEPETTADTVD